MLNSHDNLFIIIVIVYRVCHRMTELIGPSLQLRSSITPWPMTGSFMGTNYCMCTSTCFILNIIA